MAKINSQWRVLVVEDEVVIREMLVFALEKASFGVLEAGSTQEADKILQHHKPDIMILDWMLPGCSGVQYIKKLKKDPRFCTIPIIMLTARAEEHNKIAGLETGADDYVTKPFSPKELIARINSVLRRGGRIVEDIFHAGQLNMFLSRKEIFFQHQKIHFSSLEYDLVHFLATHPNKIYSREQILESIWPNNDAVTDRAVDTHVKRIRKKLAAFGCEKLIQTHRSLGYSFEPNGDG